jgi:LysM repeat protein
MRRAILAFCALSLAARGFAQEPSPAPTVDTAELRKMIEHQSAQIEALTQQVSKLTQLLERRPAGSTTIAPGDFSPSSSRSSPPPEMTDVPKAVAVPPAPVVTGPTHVVAKGETLTSIAKLYKVSVADLQKSNKIENERTLQIGQTLTIPSAKPPEPTP